MIPSIDFAVCGAGILVREKPVAFTPMRRLREGLGATPCVEETDHLTWNGIDLMDLMM